MNEHVHVISDVDKVYGRRRTFYPLGLCRDGSIAVKKTEIIAEKGLK